MSFIDHAKNEFKALGYIPLEEEQEDGPNKWIQENILELLEVFSKQGHSGMSAAFCIQYFTKLASFEPISPITDDGPWDDTYASDETIQHKRLSSVFKKTKGSRAYYLNAIVWKSADGCTFTGSAHDVSGKKYVFRGFCFMLQED